MTNLKNDHQKADFTQSFTPIRKTQKTHSEQRKLKTIVASPIREL